MHHSRLVGGLAALAVLLILLAAPVASALPLRVAWSDHYGATANDGFTALAAAVIDLSELVDLANLAVILQYIATCGAVFWLRVRRPEMPRGFRLPAAKAIAVAGCAVSLGLAREVTLHELVIGGTVIAAGLGATAGYRWRRRGQTA